MTQRRTRVRLGGAAIVFTALFAVALGSGSSAQAEGETPCTAKSFKFDKVAAACRTGGRTEAKKLMKAAVKKAKAAGESMNCKSCHSSLKDFALTPNAVTDLEKWL